MPKTTCSEQTGMHTSKRASKNGAEDTVVYKTHQDAVRKGQFSVLLKLSDRAIPAWLHFQLLQNSSKVHRSLDDLKVSGCVLSTSCNANNPQHELNMKQWFIGKNRCLLKDFFALRYWHLNTIQAASNKAYLVYGSEEQFSPRLFHQRLQRGYTSSNHRIGERLFRYAPLVSCASTAQRDSSFRRLHSGTLGLVHDHKFASVSCWPRLSAAAMIPAATRGARAMRRGSWTHRLFACLYSLAFFVRSFDWHCKRVDRTGL